jgi:hypothetical protein
MKLLLEKVQCEKYKWNICGYLNVTALFLGHTKFCCLLWEWDVVNVNVVNIPLINPEKFYLPPLHIKAMDQNGAGFVYFKNKFPSVSDENIKEGVFLGPKIRELIEDA